MILYIIRHAWAGESGDPRYPDDRLRPLTADGRERFKCVVKALARRRFAPSVLATSPLVRCRQTADIAAEHISRRAKVVELEALQPGSDLLALIRWTKEQSEEEIGWVGHAPDVSRLAANLVGGAAGGLRFAKGSVAAIHFEGGIEPGGGQLHWLVTAKMLEC